MLKGTVLSVSDLTRYIKGVLEEGFTSISVQGEISNCKRHSSGHMYFTLKDEGAQINAVMWRNRAASLFFTPQDGMKVVARGDITVYEVRGVYQIDVARLQPLGVGELQMAFERLKQRLAAEGYFKPEHKKPLPRFPQRVGVVTSPTGAAIRDIVNILARRCPSIELILYPVKVQGEGAAEEIARAIRDFNAYGKADALIVGRGGGSLEDLWPFNEETVAHAIFESRIPIISAVGHEIDFTIADFVADMRAPTPSAAAEMVICTREEMVEIVRNFCYTVQQVITGTLSSHRERISALLGSYSFNRPHDLLRQHSQRVDELQRSLIQHVHHRVTLLHQHWMSLHTRIGSASPEATLQRGYALVVKDGTIVRRARELHRDEKVELKFHDGVKPASID
ncbi:MAG: exodeoxyribonuclease VII large subunit [Ignavibacteriae bacterium]|nr:exodeoxyribonuclease VII large subunit [Ignavibacteriota bacterium]